MNALGRLCRLAAGFGFGFVGSAGFVGSGLISPWLLGLLFFLLLAVAVRPYYYLTFLSPFQVGALPLQLSRKLRLLAEWPVALQHRLCRSVPRRYAGSNPCSASFGARNAHFVVLAKGLYHLNSYTKVAEKSFHLFLLLGIFLCDRLSLQT